MWSMWRMRSYRRSVKLLSYRKNINSDAVIIKSPQMRLVRCCRRANSWFAQLLIIQLYIHDERRNLQINGLWMAAQMLAPWEKYLNCESATTIET